mgnify:CR=1 FL=1
MIYLSILALLELYCWRIISLKANMSIATALLGLLGLVIFLFSIKKPKENEPPGKYFEVNTKADFQT